MALLPEARAVLVPCLSRRRRAPASPQVIAPTPLRRAVPRGPGGRGGGAALPLCALTPTQVRWLGLAEVLAPANPTRQSSPIELAASQVAASVDTRAFKRSLHHSERYNRRGFGLGEEVAGSLRAGLPKRSDRPACETTATHCARVGSR
jgi:hypothetical protein